MLLVYVRHDKEGLLGKVARCYLKAIFLELSGFLMRFFAYHCTLQSPNSCQKSLKYNANSSET